MNSYLNYFIEANIGLVLFLVAYTLFLRNETDFKLKRIFLLIGILGSLLLPFFQFQGPTIPTLGQVVPGYFLPESKITVSLTTSETPTQENVQSIWFYLQWIYIAGLLFFLSRFALQLHGVLRMMHRSKKTRIGKVKLAEIDDKIPTFSFFNVIILGSSNELSEAEKQKIIRHESVHVNQFHSFDILLIHLVSIAFWLNPFLRTYKKIFIQLHEFEADARAVENHDVNEYCRFLAKAALASAGFTLANHFNNSLILKRIEMMKTIKRTINPWKMLMTASVIPVVIFLVACQDQVLRNEGILGKVEQPAMPEGGYGAFYEYLGKKINYPKEARDKGIVGKVLVEFVVDTDGTINVTGTSGVGGGCDLEGIEAVQGSPKWKPAMNNGVAVQQQIVLPISFKLAGLALEEERQTNNIQVPAGAIGEIVVVGYYGI